MTPEQALQLLDRVCGATNMPRQDHFNVQNAVQILAVAIEKSKKGPESEKEDDKPKD